MMLGSAGGSLNYGITTPAAAGGQSIMLAPGSPSPLGGTGTGTAQYFQVDGVLFGGQTTAPGDYQDTAVVTVTF
jgi:spore coat protein U-like protein